ncbi:hypothetical protein NDU88_000396 [Pleurodeles waltl]|uniref:Uncharacterized protein n=1 Tax=Pleurodeles waltl TaxID=8319 RepID=A0AAV7UPU9_PLEWA|nr:hypothetical protein NDU88_000396 [Pleurodeles waltl]
MSWRGAEAPSPTDKHVRLPVQTPGREGATVPPAHARPARQPPRPRFSRLRLRLWERLVPARDWLSACWYARGKRKRALNLKLCRVGYLAGEAQPLIFQFLSNS